MTVQSRPDYDRLLEWWGLARYDPDAVDVDRLSAEIPATTEPAGAPPDGREGYWPWARAGLACRALAQLASAEPRRVVRVAGRLFVHLDGGRIETPAARTLGTVGADDDWVLGELLACVPDAPPRRLRNAVRAIEWTAYHDPERVESAVTDLVWAHGRAFRANGSDLQDAVAGFVGDGSIPPEDADDVARAAAGTLGRLAAVDGSTRIRIRDLLDDEMPSRRACGARALGRVAGQGVPEARDAVPAVAELLSDGNPGVRSAAAIGLGAAARTVPGVVAPHADALLDATGDAVHEAAKRTLTDVCRGDRRTFEWALDRLVERVPVPAHLPDDPAVDRLVAAVREVAGVHPYAFARYDDAIHAVMTADPDAGARAVERAGQWCPDRLGTVVKRLLERIRPDAGRRGGAGAGQQHQRHVRRRDPAPFDDALAALAPANPVIPQALQRFLVDAAPGRPRSAGAQFRRRDPYSPGWRPSDTTGPQFTTVARACGTVAETAPDALLSAARGPNPGGGPDLVSVLWHQLDGPTLDRGVTATLARLGRHDSAVVRPVADVVAWRLPEALGRTMAGDHVRRIHPGQAMGAGRSRALFDLGGVTARVAPDELLGVAGDVVADLRTVPGMVDHAVGFLADLCVVAPRFLPEVVGMVDSDARPAALVALADAARERPAELLPYVDTLFEASVGHQHDRAVRAATRALATVATGVGRGEPSANGERERLAERLRTLVYDPEPALRRWAAFGLGELAREDADGSASLDRVRRVADRADDAAAGAARLALVRAGRRPAAESVDALATVAVECQRPMASTALSELLDVVGPDAAAIDRVAATATDPAVGRQARGVSTDRPGR